MLNFANFGNFFLPRKLFRITCVRMNTFRIRMWLMSQRWKNRLERGLRVLRRWRRSMWGDPRLPRHRPRLEQLDLPFD